jgi:hypothetical protein
MRHLLLVGTLAAALSLPAVATAQGTAAGTSLGTVTLGQAVMADGKPLPAGSYQLRLTDEAPEPGVGQSPDAARYVEFVRGGKVVGREVATIIPQAEIAEVAEGPRPRTGGSRVELLKGGDYVRVWVNRGGMNYILHMPPAKS